MELLKGIVSKDCEHANNRKIRRSFISGITDLLVWRATYRRYMQVRLYAHMYPHARVWMHLHGGKADVEAMHDP